MRLKTVKMYLKTCLKIRVSEKMCEKICNVI